jgi:hypothetical protein
MRVESERVSLRSHRERALLVWLLLAALWAVGIAIFAGVGALEQVHGAAFACWTPIGLLAGTSLLLGLSRGALAGSARRLSPGSLIVENGTVEVRMGGRHRQFPVTEIVSGWTEADGEGPGETAVLLLRDGTEVRAACRWHAVAQRLLQQAGVAPDQRAVRLRVRAGTSSLGRAWDIFLAFLAGIVAILMGLVSLVAVVGGSMLFFVVFAAACVGAAYGARRSGRALVSTTLSVGTDGVLVEGPLRRRLVRRHEILDVTPGADALTLTLEAGDRISIPCALASGLVVASRIEESFRAPLDPTASVNRLDREGRPVATWIADLRALSGGALGYREAALAREDLIDVVKDGSAPADRRIAAAVVLSSQRDVESRTALRIAADTCVDERLRAVLGGAAEMEEEALVEAVSLATADR